MLMHETAHDRVREEQERGLGQLGALDRIGAERGSRVLADLKIVDGDDGNLIGYTEPTGSEHLNDANRQRISRDKDSVGQIIRARIK